VANPLVRALVVIGALKAIATEARFALATTPTLVVDARGVGMAPSILPLALVDILTEEAIPNVPRPARTAVAAKGVITECVGVAVA
jgi:hypothetical protein